MSRAWLLFVVLGCGQPEDVLVIEGRVRGVTLFESFEPIPLVAYRDLGATDFGCTEFSVWRELESAVDGEFRIEALRQETTGRYGLPRCLRVEWRDVALGRSASLSWVARPRDTLLPDLLTWFDRPGATPSFPLDAGSILPAQLSFEVRDERGVVFRQAAAPDVNRPLTGPGPAPAFESEVVSRILQRGQQRQRDSFGSDPLVPFEYRIESSPRPFTGDRALLELAQGGSCAITTPGGSVCAVTDGLFTPVDVGADAVEVTLPSPVPVHTVVLRGIGSITPFAAVVVDGQTAEAPAYGDPSFTPVASTADLIATSTLEDAQPVLYVIVHWLGTFEPVTKLRVRLVDSAGAPIEIAWLGEVSVY